MLICVLNSQQGKLSVKSTGWGANNSLSLKETSMLRHVSKGCELGQIPYFGKIKSSFIHNVNLLGKNKVTINKTTDILRSEILMAVLHENRVFLNVTLHCGVIDPYVLMDHNIFILRAKQSKKMKML
jgi:hypothetical protein